MYTQPARKEKGRGRGRGKGKKSAPPRWCVICGETGHAAFECESGKQQERDVCWNCGKDGHAQWNCTSKRKGRPLQRKSTSTDDRVKPPPPVRKSSDHSSVPVPPWLRQKIEPRPKSINKLPSTKWLIDSGCTGHHITPCRNVFKSLRQASREPIRTAAEGEMLDVKGEGDTDGFIWTAEGQVKVTLYNVL